MPISPKPVRVSDIYATLRRLSQTQLEEWAQLGKQGKISLPLAVAVETELFMRRVRP